MQGLSFPPGPSSSYGSSSSVRSRHPEPLPTQVDLAKFQARTPARFRSLVFAFSSAFASSSTARSIHTYLQSLFLVHRLAALIHLRLLQPARQRPRKQLPGGGGFSTTRSACTGAATMGGTSCPASVDSAVVISCFWSIIRNLQRGPSPFVHVRLTQRPVALVANTFSGRSHWRETRFLAHQRHTGWQLGVRRCKLPKSNLACRVGTVMFLAQQNATHT